MKLLSSALLLLPLSASAQYLVKPQCAPVVNSPGFFSVNESVRVNSKGVCVSWECIPSTWTPGQNFTVSTYCGTWTEVAKASPRIDTIRKAADPLKSLQDAGKRFPIKPLSDPMFDGLPK